MVKVMISYRNVPDQKAFAQELSDAFETSGVNTWLDVKDIGPLSKWEDAIVDGIKNSDYVAVCLSPEYFESDICMMECYIARGYRKKILPIAVSQSPTYNVFHDIMDHEETKGLEDLNIAFMYEPTYAGLPLTKYERIQRIVAAVVNPVPQETKYDIYVSYKFSQAEFATRIADDLNRENLSTFIMTTKIYPGDIWREVTWNAMLQAKYHIVVLTPDIKDSVYIKNEIRVSRTKETVFVPILADTLANDQQAQDDILNTFKTREFALLNDTQWLRTDKGYDHMMQSLINFLGSQKVS